MWTSCLYARSAREVQWKNQLINAIDTLWTFHFTMHWFCRLITQIVFIHMNWPAFTRIKCNVIQPLSCARDDDELSTLSHTQENIQFHELNLFIFNDSLTLCADTRVGFFRKKKKTSQLSATFSMHTRFDRHSAEPETNTLLRLAYEKKFNDLQCSIIIVKL